LAKTNYETFDKGFGYPPKPIWIDSTIRSNGTSALSLRSRMRSFVGPRKRKSTIPSVGTKMHPSDWTESPAPDAGTTRESASFTCSSVISGQ